VPERKLGKTEFDFLKAKEVASRAAESLKKKYPWIKDFRFMGDTSFKSNRSKASIKAAVDRGEEVSFGLNMMMTYVDLKGKVRISQVILKFKDHPFYSIVFKSYTEGSTLDDVRKQFENTWVILASGNTPEEPTAYVVAKISDFPAQCFTPIESRSGKERWNIMFNKYIKWKPAKQMSIFGDDVINDEFEKIRK